MSDATTYDAGLPPPRIVEPLADCASARAGGHLAPGADATTVPGVLSRKRICYQHPSRFTAEEIAHITQMRADGASMKDVSIATGRTMKSLENAVLRGTIPRFRKYQWTADAVQRLLAMKRDGASMDEIAKAFGISKNSIWERMRIAEGKGRQRRTVHEARPRSETKAAALKERRCLCGCNKMFLSEGPGNRISPTCREVFGNRHTGAV